MDDETLRAVLALTVAGFVKLNEEEDELGILLLVFISQVVQVICLSSPSLGRTLETKEYRWWRQNFFGYVVGSGGERSSWTNYLHHHHHNYNNNNNFPQPQ
jgi:hypothetical protein